MKFEKIPLTEEEQIVHDYAVRISRIYKTSGRKLVTAISRVDSICLHEKFGETSIYSYCTKVLGHTESISYALQGIARASRTVPELKAAVESGEISVCKAIKLCAQITPENQRDWLAQAKVVSKSELERRLAAANPKPSRRTSKKPIDGKTTRYAIDLPNRVIEKQKRVRELECQRTRKSVSEAEAYEAALDLYLERNDPVLKAERAKVRESFAQAKPVGSAQAKPVGSARAKPESSARPKPEIFAQAKSSQPKPAESFKRKPLNAKVEHARNGRDSGQCKIVLPDGRACHQSTWTEGHHIIPVAEGGSNELDNLITVCAKHHKMLHKFENSNRRH